MPRHTVAPVESPDQTFKGGTRVTHPAFAMIGADRVTAAPGVVLFGSDFRHSSFVRITLKRAELSRDLSRDKAFARDEIVSVDLSEAQWAHFVSAMNIGDGAQCTLARMPGADIPGLPDPVDRKSQFAKESAETAQDVLDSIKEARAAVQESGLSAKKQKEILDRLDKAAMNAGSNQRFVARQFSEHMETTVQHAAIEIDAMLTNAVRQVGLDTIRANGISAPNLTMIEQKAGDAAELEVYDCGLSIRTANLLNAEGLHTLARVAEFTALIDNIRGLGPASIEEIRTALAAREMNLHGE